MKNVRYACTVTLTLPSESTSYTTYVVCMSLKGPIGEVEVSICDSFSPPLLQCSFPLISLFLSLPLFPRSPFPRGTLSLCWLSQIRGPSSLSLSLFLHLSLCRFCLAGFVPPSPVCQPPAEREKATERRKRRVEISDTLWDKVQEEDRRDIRKNEKALLINFP